jgi:hypothetical protein
MPYMAADGVDPSVYPYDTFKPANLTFTPSEVQILLNQTTGDFKAFQYYMEQVCFKLNIAAHILNKIQKGSINAHFNPYDSWRVSYLLPLLDI